MNPSLWPFLALGFTPALPALLLPAPWRLPLALLTGSACGLLAWLLAANRRPQTPAGAATSHPLPPLAPPQPCRRRDEQVLAALQATFDHTRAAGRQLQERLVPLPADAADLAQGAVEIAERAETADLALVTVGQSFAPLADGLPLLVASVDAGRDRLRQLLQQAEEALRLGRSAQEELDQADAAGHRTEALLQRQTEQTREIGAIAELIRELVSDTELLAFNAAIIAARAGEQGQAFAVVADEVRELADRTAGSAREIQRLLQDLGRSTGELRLAVETAVRRAGLGLHHVRSGTQRLRQLLSVGEEMVAELGEVRDLGGRQAELAEQTDRRLHLARQQWQELVHLLRDHRTAAHRFHRAAAVPEAALALERQLTELQGGLAELTMRHELTATGPR